MVRGLSRIFLGSPENLRMIHLQLLRLLSGLDMVMNLELGRYSESIFHGAGVESYPVLHTRAKCDGCCCCLSCHVSATKKADTWGPRTKCDTFITMREHHEQWNNI